MISIRIFEGDLERVTGTRKGCPIELEPISPTVMV